VVVRATDGTARHSGGLLTAVSKDRSLVPETALQLALVVLAAAVVWLSVTLWQRAVEPATA
jgi:hypothetical protein